MISRGEIITTYIHRYECLRSKEKEIFVIDGQPSSGSYENWMYCQTYKLTKYADEKPNTDPWEPLRPSLGLTRKHGPVCKIEYSKELGRLQFMGYEDE